MKKALFVIVFSVICAHLNAQHSFGVKASGGLSLLRTVYTDASDADEQKFRPQPSYQGGLFYAYLIKERFLLGLEANYLTARGKEMESFTVNYSSTSRGEVRDTIWRNISYIGFPVYFGFNTGESNFSLGFQYNYYLSSNGKMHMTITNSGSPPTSSERSYEELNVDRYDFGVRAGYLYLIGNKLHVEVNYYHGLNNFLNTENLSRDAWNWKAYQFTIGLRYSIVGNTTYVM